jgi:hypothetical protein
VRPMIPVTHWPNHDLLVVHLPIAQLLLVNRVKQLPDRPAKSKSKVKQKSDAVLRLYFFLMASFKLLYVADSSILSAISSITSTPK